jgi:hypothetical protein
VEIAETFLREQKQIDLSGWKLVEANSDKRPNRTDHTLTWRQTAPLDPQNAAAKDSSDHAYERMSVSVLGDEPGDYRTFIKIPEEFERQQQEQGVARILVGAGQLCVALGLCITVLVYFFKRMRAQTARIPWRRLLGWGLAGLGAYLASLFLGRGIPAFLMNYPTTMPMRLFFGTIGVFILLSGGFVLGVVALLFGLAWSFAARAFGEEQLPGWLGMPAAYYRDAFWLGLGGSAALIALRRLLDFASAWWPTLHRGIPSNFGDSFDAVFPSIGAMGSAVLHGLVVSAVVLLAGAFLGAELRVKWLRLVLFIAVAAALVTSWGSPADFLKQFLVSAIVLTVVVLGIRRLVRFNLLGLFLIVACTGLVSVVSELITQPNAFYRTNAYLILTALLVLLAWPLVAWRMRTQGPAVG